MQIISCTDTDGLGSIILQFRQQSTQPLSPNANMATVKDALESLSSIRIVAVGLLNSANPDRLCTSTGNSFTISFITEHGSLPNIIVTSKIGINSIAVTKLVVGEYLKRLFVKICVFSSYL